MAKKLPLFRPFPAIRPANDKAQEIVAPPYDVLNTKEAIEKAKGKPYSFLHVSKPEIDLPEGTDPYSMEVYGKGAENFDDMLEEGVINRDEKPYYYVYKAVMGEHTQTGLVVSACVDDYDSNRIRKHEYTRVAKEDDRVRQIKAVNAQTGPVLLAYKQIDEVAKIISKTVENNKPEYDVVGDNDVRHALWVIKDEADIETITQEFEKQEAVYIADGHHRSAAASRIANERRKEEKNPTGEELYNSFLAVAFPADEMKVYDYNRVVKDLNGMTKEEFMKKIEEEFVISEQEKEVSPSKTKEFGMYIDGKWYKLETKNPPSNNDPVENLDVSILSDKVLTPVLDIKDLRKSNRIDFVGGIRGLKELEKRVDSGEMVVAFSLFPTSLDDLIAVADANKIMPPKSTWFEPKLADGMASNPLD